MALGPSDINNLNRFGQQLGSSVNQLSSTVAGFESSLNKFASRLEVILPSGGGEDKGGGAGGGKQAGGIVQAAKDFDKILGGTATKLSKTIGGLGKGSGFAIIVSLAKTLFKQLDGINYTSAQVTGQFGLTRKHSEALVMQGRVLSRGAAAYAGQWDLIAKTVNKTEDAFYGNVEASMKMAEFITKMSKGIGVAEADAGKLSSVLMLGMGASEKSAKNYLAYVKVFAESKGKTAAKLIKTMAGDTSVMARMSAQEVTSYAKIANYAVDRGMEMSAIAAFQRKELDYGSTITKTMKVNQFLGLKLNARSLFQKEVAGDMVGYQKEILGAVAEQYKSFGQLDNVQQNMLRNLTGMTEQELQRGILIERKEKGLDYDQQALDLLDKELAAKADAATLESQMYANMQKQATAMERIKQAFVDGFLTPLDNFVQSNYGGMEGFIQSLVDGAKSLGGKIGKVVSYFIEMGPLVSGIAATIISIAPYLMGGMGRMVVRGGQQVFNMGKNMLKDVGRVGRSAFKGAQHGKGTGFLGGAKGGMRALTRTGLGRMGAAGGIISLGMDLAGAFSSDIKKNRKATGGMLGGAAGAAIGAALGGPVGAAIGYGIGSLIGNFASKYFKSDTEVMYENLQKRSEMAARDLQAAEFSLKTAEQSFAAKQESAYGAFEEAQLSLTEQLLNVGGTEAEMVAFYERMMAEGSLQSKLLEKTLVNVFGEQGTTVENFKKLLLDLKGKSDDVNFDGVEALDIAAADLANSFKTAVERDADMMKYQIQEDRARRDVRKIKNEQQSFARFDSKIDSFQIGKDANVDHLEKEFSGPNARLFANVLAGDTKGGWSYEFYDLIDEHGSWDNTPENFKLLMKDFFGQIYGKDFQSEINAFVDEMGEGFYKDRGIYSDKVIEKWTAWMNANYSEKIAKASEKVEKAVQTKEARLDELVTAQGIEIDDGIISKTPIIPVNDAVVKPSANDSILAMDTGALVDALANNKKVVELLEQMVEGQMEGQPVVIELEGETFSGTLLKSAYS